MRRIYLAHPLSDDPVRNQLNAARWGIWIAKTFQCAVSADWIWWSQVLDESPENRALGLRADCASIERCDELWLTGGRISGGMKIESGHAGVVHIPVRDLTDWGYRSPLDWPALLQKEDVSWFIKRVKIEWETQDSEAFAAVVDGGCP